MLHTSDWHLGRLFHGVSLIDEQRAALERIVAIVRERKVDVVLIAGDLYDRAIPPAEAVDLFERTLAELHGHGVTVVAISGNHDSGVRVGVRDTLLERVGVAVRGDASRTGEPIVIDGRDGGTPVRIYPIPYLEPLAISPLVGPMAEGSGAEGSVAEGSVATGDAPLADAATSRRSRLTHHGAMSWAMDRVRADLAGAGPSRSVVVAHTFVTGGDPTESERDLTVGNIEQVSMSAFKGVDLVALGHLHRRQSFDGGRVAYSGTPLPYSFSEQNDIKSVRIIDLTPDGSIEVEQVTLGVGRRMRTLTGTINDLLGDPALTDVEQDRLRIQLTDDLLPMQAMARLRERFPHVVELRHLPASVPSSEPAASGLESLEHTDPVAVATQFLHERRGVPATRTERSILTDTVRTIMEAETA